MARHRLIVVGSGPAGYTAAIYAARAGLEPVVFEGSLLSGGALMNTTEVENFPGFQAGVDGPDLMLHMREQAERFGARMIRDDIMEADLTATVKTLVDGSGKRHEADAVILATGSEYRTLGLESEARLSGRGVSWCATCDAPFFKGRDVAVIGGGDSAMEEAIYLARFARSVTVVHRRDRLRASSIMRERAMAHEQISFLWNSSVAEILGEGRVSGVMLENYGSEGLTMLEAHGVFVAIGHTPRSELFRDQLETDDDGYIRVEHPSSRTSVPGVFACGDVVDRTYRQAVTAAASGCVAALDADAYLSGSHMHDEAMRTEAA